jgi:opacity protein-like surface antigen
MRTQIASGLFFLSFTACATSRPSDGRVPVSAFAPTEAAAAAPAKDVAPPAPRRVLGDSGYTRFSFGAFSPDGDISSLDDGYYGQVAFGTDILHFLAVEASLGYLSADGSTNEELTALPVLVSGRAQLPILIFEAYGGVGVGGMYADYQVGPFNDDEFLLAGTAFAGFEVGLGNLAIGLEYRYLTSEETDAGFTIEGHCGLLTVTLPF